MYDQVKWASKEKRCLDPSHYPPTMIVLEPGIHTWKCPSCGKEQKVIVEERPTLKSSFDDKFSDLL